ncbi:hypothetical protein A3F66_03065 [candidate division TM6 bacterium RIFCSPHIGHO2_12_FULL_32_22]|nr:MAG: hypothetical protein A3F66_03065 [candidate division TM6 bacterium RIFCSPHIGHO2_12_FULL_32_22]
MIPLRNKPAVAKSYGGHELRRTSRSLLPASRSLGEDWSECNESKCEDDGEMRTLFKPKEFL